MTKSRKQTYRMTGLQVSAKSCVNSLADEAAPVQPRTRCVTLPQRLGHFWDIVTGKIHANPRWLPETSRSRCGSEVLTASTGLERFQLRQLAWICDARCLPSQTFL